MYCHHFHTCGGCSLPGVPYDEQLRRKQARLGAWFPDLAPVPLLGSPVQSGFRHKVAFVFDPRSSGRGLVMGHYRVGSRQVVPVRECPVHAPRGNELAFRLRDCLAASRVPAGVLRHVLVRTIEGSREAVLMLVVRVNHRALRAPVRAFLDEPDPPDGFFLNVHDRPDGFMVGRETVRLAGRAHVCEELAGTRFLISPTAFFQTNVRAARVLLDCVRRAAGQPRDVLDLYSGSGLFALPLAAAGARVVAVEENRQAVKDAEANIRLNRLAPEAVRLLAGRVEDVLARLRGRRFDLIVLDPPRQGCPDGVIDAVAAVGAPRVIYVSCNPGRLSAERERFARRGYALTRLQGLDMFPHTGHMEAIGLFEPRAHTAT